MHLQQLVVSLVTDADFENKTEDYEINLMKVYQAIKGCLDDDGVDYRNLTVSTKERKPRESSKNR